MVALHVADLGGDVVRREDRRAGDVAGLALRAERGERRAHLHVVAEVRERAGETAPGEGGGTKEAAGVLPHARVELAVRAKKLGFDAIHDTVHEMAKDEARHGSGFAGLLKRYFGE